MEIAAILEFFFYAIVLVGRLFLKIISGIGWLIMEMQVILLKVGIVFCVVYDACAVASITALIMKGKGINNALTQLFDKLVNGKIAQGSYHLVEKFFDKSDGGNANFLEIFITIIVVFFAFTIGIVIANAIIWWPFMLASIIIQAAIYVITTIRLKSIPNDSVLATAPPETIDLNQSSTNDMDEKV
jgi:hypothetical protein